jgi:multiple sugar transport system ATP-binding protein
MGRAMVRDPQVFLFDEPLSNLDAKLRVQMRTEIRALHQRLGTTSIYVTHDQIEAMTMADRIVVLRDGQVAQMGTPADLYDQPRDTFVAGFIGSPAMNLIAGKCYSTWTSIGFDSKIALETRFASSFSGADGRAVTVGLRPEHLRVHSADTAGSELPHGFLQVQVKVVEFTGADTLLSCELAGPPSSPGSPPEPISIQALVHDRVAAKPGDTVRLSIDPQRLHLFDEASGLRL